MCSDMRKYVFSYHKHYEQKPYTKTSEKGNTVKISAYYIHQYIEIYQRNISPGLSRNSKTNISKFREIVIVSRNYMNIVTTINGL